VAFLSAFFSSKIIKTMPFEKAYDLMTSLMEEAYDPKVKEWLDLGSLDVVEVQAEAVDYFDGFHGVLYFFAGGLQRDTTPIICYINRLNRIADILFRSCWDIHVSLVNHLLSVEMRLPVTCSKIAAKKEAIEEMKECLRSTLVKSDNVDLDHCDTEAVEVLSAADLVPEWGAKKPRGKKVSLRPLVPRIYWKFLSIL